VGIEDDLQNLRVPLPPGRLIVPEDGDEPVLWLSDGPAPPGLWARLRAEHPATGLWPLRLGGLDGAPERPWADGELTVEDIAAPEELDELDAAEILERLWNACVEDGDGQRRRMLKPFGFDWPGLAPAALPAGDPDTHADRCADTAVDPSWQLGLVVAQRGADTLAVTGWSGPLNHADSSEIAAVVRSWEDRFGVRVVGVGFANLVLSVAAPPKTKDHAVHVAAEHFAFCPDNVWQGIEPLRMYARYVYDAGTWSFWWD
jgi:hypothetical protein